MSATVQECRSCGADIVWLAKPTGDGRMIVNASPEAIRRALAGERWEAKREDLVSHFATCAQAATWRSTRKGTRR